MNYKRLLVYLGIILAIVVVNFFPRGNKPNVSTEYWNGIYYPNGCLPCSEDWIFSPVFASRNECLYWGGMKWKQLSNPSDLYECGKNCIWGGEVQSCDETIGMKGTGKHNVK